jgi:hypothetical protein
MNVSSNHLLSGNEQSLWRTEVSELILHCTALWLAQFDVHFYRMFRAQADSTLTHTSHKEPEKCTIEASVTLDDVTLTHSLIK